MINTAVVLLYLTDVIFLTTNILLLYVFLTPKRPFWFQAIAFMATAITVYWLRIFLEPIFLNFSLCGFITGPLYIVTCMLLFKEKLHATVFVFFMIYSLTQFIYLIFMHIDFFLAPQIPGILVFSGILIEMFFLPLINKYIAPPIKDIIQIINQENSIFTLFPVLSFILLAFYGVQGTYSLYTFIPLVLSVQLIFFSYYLIATSIDQTRRHHQLEKQLALQRDHYHNLNNSIAAAKTTRHDLRHHLVTILGLLNNTDTSSAQEYLKKLCTTYDDSSLPLVCGNQSAAALICYYVKLAKQENIAIATNLYLPDNLRIDDLDLCVILGNCLENSIEACSKISDVEVEPPFININTTISKGYLVIKIVNSFNGYLQQKNNSFFSNKEGTDHGIGLSSVKTLVTKYQGQCSISSEQQIFKVSLSLKLQKNVA